MVVALIIIFIDQGSCVHFMISSVYICPQFSNRSTSSIISVTSLLVTSSSSSSLVEVLQTSTLMVLCLYPHIPQELHQCVRTIISRPEFSLHLYAVCVTLFLCSTTAAHLKLNKIIFYRQHQLLQRFKTISFVKYLFLALDF